MTVSDIPLDCKNEFCMSTTYLNTLMCFAYNDLSYALYSRTEGKHYHSEMRKLLSK